jgi:aminoglycoside phosphotransferase (APT) family kinase protein
VFVDGVPTAFIDFDAAHAGARVDDVGYAAWLWLDIGEDIDAELQGRRLVEFFVAMANWTFAMPFRRSSTLKFG